MAASATGPVLGPTTSSESLSPQMAKEPTSGALKIMKLVKKSFETHEWPRGDVSGWAKSPCKIGDVAASVKSMPNSDHYASLPVDTTPEFDSDDQCSDDESRSGVDPSPCSVVSKDGDDSEVIILM